MRDTSLVLRRMTETDLALALDWAAAEGWNPGLHDAHCFYAADPEGFFLGLIDGVPIGCVSAVRYGSGFGFLGLYIVKAERRGRGFGFALWRAALDHLGERVIGLDGVVAQQENYRKSGFRLAYRNVRRRGVGGGAAPGALTDLAAVPFDEIARYDASVFSAPREAFLKPWISQPQAAALGVVEESQLKRLWRSQGLPRRIQDRAAVRRRRRDGGASLRGPACSRARRARLSGHARSQSGRRRARRAPRDGPRLRDGAHVQERQPRDGARPLLRRDELRTWIARAPQKAHQRPRGDCAS